MNGDAELPHRSSSPLKRRASSMDPENGAAASCNGEDVNMDASLSATAADSTDAPRAMSVDPQDGVDGPAQSKLANHIVWRDPGAVHFG